MMDVHYNVGRDRARQSPRHSMRLHMASCSGISIILIDTCRALGIPARERGYVSKMALYGENVGWQWQ